MVSDFWIQATGTPAILKSELQPERKHIVFQIFSETRQTGFFIFHMSGDAVGGGRVCQFH